MRKRKTHEADLSEGLSESTTEDIDYPDSDCSLSEEVSDPEATRLPYYESISRCISCGDHHVSEEDCDGSQEVQSAFITALNLHQINLAVQKAFKDDPSIVQKHVEEYLSKLPPTILKPPHREVMQDITKCVSFSKLPPRVQRKMNKF